MKILKPLMLGLSFGSILGSLNWNNRLEKFVTKHPFLSVSLSFGMGALTTILYFSYQQSINGVKLPSFPEGIIKKRNSPVRSWAEIFGKRTRDTIIWQWPTKAIKSGTKVEYQRIWTYYQGNRDKTYDELAEDLAVSRKTLERALRAGRLGQLK